MPSREQRRLLRTLANTLLALLGILATAWVVFGLLYWHYEDYRLIESLHWSMQTLTTTGYGDKPPQTDAGMVLSMMLQPLAVVTTLLLGANFVREAIEDPNVFTHDEQVKARECDDDTNARVRRAERGVEYLLYRMTGERIENLDSRHADNP